ncbi:hypothetical protein H6F38_28590 [Paenibacillus sp. EKM208P]|nr:hypothetical protein [Paenibacillus sp. EKM212P]KAF6579116.1 hypothetical protein G9G54_10335 [Paenibacillus sp. EKM212P]KAF6622332.1 hypothetical protein H6F38_28590 [Paenibacillus sp. EKM208P]
MNNKKAPGGYRTVSGALFGDIKNQTQNEHKNGVDGIVLYKRSDRFKSFP